MTFAGRLARWTAALALAAAGSGLAAAPAVAHPTDEVLQQAYLTPTASRLEVQLDLTPGVLVAPAFARTVDTDGNGEFGSAETAAHMRRVTSALEVHVDGRAVALKVTGSTYPPYELLAAAGGAVSVEAVAALPAGARAVTFINAYDPGARTTVQEDVLVAAHHPVHPAGIERGDGGRTITMTLAGLAGSPSPGSPGKASVQTAADSGGGAMLSALRSPQSSPWTLLALLGTCALLGAFHALTPGHGKTLLASYLVGAHSTPKQAVILGAVITFTHTASVIALGTAVLLAGHFVVPEVLVPVLEVVSGTVVLILGARLLRRRWRQHTDQQHADGHSHDHSHSQGHADEHASHHHAPTLPTTFRSIATMGVSGGIIPCPEALSVLLLAIGLGRTALGLTMIVSFSAGLAGVLVGLGLVLVSARTRVERFRRSGDSPLVQWLPVVSAAVVTTLGLTIAAGGVTALVE
ncbi:MULTISPECIES: sulfite exporter TauE/SafE family protein [unclassified Streptomyces]|uniref:nickel/cobalt transporter n=1 Tax=unclassified Streptomyces TaxID=2593676 RepID=UPI00331F97BE